MRQAGISPPSRTQLRIIESSAAISEGQDEDQIAFHHTYFCQTALPYRKSSERIWFRTNGRVSLRVEAGAIGNPEDGTFVELPLPFGAPARLILIHLDTEAINSQSPEIAIEDSMTAFITRLQNGRSPNGAELRLFKQQAAAVLSATFRLLDSTGESAHQGQGTIASGLDLWYPKNDRQRVLWPSFVTLNTDYFQSLKNHAVPLDHRAVAALAHNALALDIYKWLAQRLCRVDAKAPAFLTWPAVQLQFGQAYGRLRAFRAIFLKTLKTVLTQYPNAKVTADRKGLTLYRSRPPIAPKIFPAGLFHKPL
jgi:hypothetical protein